MQAPAAPDKPARPARFAIAILAMAMTVVFSTYQSIDVVAQAQKSSSQQFDLILCDLMMPQVTGMDLHAALMQLDAAQASRVVFMTGGAFTPSARSMVDLPAMFGPVTSQMRPPAASSKPGVSCSAARPRMQSFSMKGPAIFTMPVFSI